MGVSTRGATPTAEASPPAGFRRRIYRRHGHRIGLALIYLVPVVYFGIFALDNGPGADPVPTSQRLLYAALCLPWLALAARTLRVGVLLTADGVVVRNVMRTRRLPWAEIERFELGEWGGFPCGAVRLRNGDSVTAFALNPPFELTPGEHPVVPRLLKELNEDLGRARAAGLAGPPGVIRATDSPQERR